MKPPSITDEARLVQWGFPLLIIGSAVCCTTILLFPWLVHWGSFRLASGIWYIFSHVCHQEVARCMILLGVSLPVCARCLAIYLGSFLGVLIAPSCRIHAAWLLSRGDLLLGPVILVGVDVSLDMAGIWPNTGLSRVGTGGILGLVLGLYTTLSLERRS